MNYKRILAAGLLLLLFCTIGTAANAALGEEFLPLDPELFPEPTFDPQEYTPDGMVVAESENQYGMQFHIIQTEDGHTFFLVISGQSVYFLDEVKDADMISFLQTEDGTANPTKDPGNTESPPPGQTPTPDGDDTESPGDQRGDAPPKDDDTDGNQDNPSGVLSFLRENAALLAAGLAAVAFFFVAYFFKIVKPKRMKMQAIPIPDEDGDDDFDDEIPYEMDAYGGDDDDGGDEVYAEAADEPEPQPEPETPPPPRAKPKNNTPAAKPAEKARPDTAPPKPASKPKPAPPEPPAEVYEEADGDDGQWNDSLFENDE